MTDIPLFSGQRIIYLIRRELYENLKTVAIGFGAFLGLAAVIVILNFIVGGEAWKGFSTYFLPGMFITGLFISGMAFRAFRTKEGTMAYLSLPASILEKFVSELLLTTIGFIAVYTAVFGLFDTLFITAGNMLNGSDVAYFRFFNSNFPYAVLVYIIIQSVFLAGAATFRKVPLFFTAFRIFLISLAITTYVVLLAFLLKDNFADMPQHSNVNININPMSDDPSDFWPVQAAKFVFYYLTAPVFWAITVFKMKEKEV